MKGERPPETPRPSCGAKTRSGTPCKRAPARGRTRCRLHGGATPIGKGRAAGGLYSRCNLTRGLAWARVLRGEVPLPERRPDRYAYTMACQIVEPRERAVVLRYRGQEADELDTWERVMRMLPSKTRRLLIG